MVDRFTHHCTIQVVDGNDITIGMIRPNATVVELAAECAVAMTGQVPVYGEVLGTPGRAAVVPAASIVAVSFDAVDPDMADLAAVGVSAGAQ